MIKNKLIICEEKDLYTNPDIIFVADSEKTFYLDGSTIDSIYEFIVALGSEQPEKGPFVYEADLENIRDVFAFEIKEIKINIIIKNYEIMLNNLAFQIGENLLMDLLENIITRFEEGEAVFTRGYYPRKSIDIYLVNGEVDYTKLKEIINDIDENAVIADAINEKSRQISQKWDNKNK